MGSVQVKYKSKMLKSIDTHGFLSASQAEHEGSIPFTCSIEESPVTAEIATVTGFLLFLAYHRFRKKKRVNTSDFLKAYKILVYQLP